MRQVISGLKGVVIHDTTFAVISFIVENIDDMPPFLINSVPGAVVLPVWVGELSESIDYQLPQFNVHCIRGYHSHCMELMEIINDHFVKKKERS